MVGLWSWLLSILWIALGIWRVWIRVGRRIAHCTVALLIDHATLLARVLTWNLAVRWSVADGW